MVNQTLLILLLGNLLTRLGSNSVILIFGRPGELKPEENIYMFKGQTCGENKAQLRYLENNTRRQLWK